MYLPTYWRTHQLARKHIREQRSAWRRWRQQRACAELKWYVDRVLQAGSADGYKDDPYRNQTLMQYSADEARKHYGEKVKQKVSDLRKRWGLAEYRDVRMTGTVTHHRETRDRKAERRDLSPRPSLSLRKS